MKRLRTIAASAILSLALLGGAASAAGARAVTPSASFPECVTHMAMDGGVGPHVQGMEHEESTVGGHLRLMLSGEHDCMHEMD